MQKGLEGCVTVVSGFKMSHLNLHDRLDNYISELPHPCHNNELIHYLCLLAAQPTFYKKDVNVNFFAFKYPFNIHFLILLS